MQHHPPVIRASRLLLHRGEYVPALVDQISRVGFASVCFCMTFLTYKHQVIPTERNTGIVDVLWRQPYLVVDDPTGRIDSF